MGALVPTSLGLLVATALIALLSIPIWRVVTRGRARTTIAGPVCPACQYPVSGLPEQETCPECGADWRTTGILTPALLARNRGHLPSAIACWTVLMLLASDWIVPRIADLVRPTPMVTVLPTAPPIAVIPADEAPPLAGAPTILSPGDPATGTPRIEIRTSPAPAGLDLEQRVTIESPAPARLGNGTGGATTPGLSSSQAAWIARGVVGLLWIGGIIAIVLRRRTLLERAGGAV